MVASKKVHCAYCQKKCSGNVLRYQDQYYHKQCFELEQNDLATAQRVASASDSNSIKQQQVLAPQSAGNKSNTIDVRPQTSASNGSGNGQLPPQVPSTSAAGRYNRQSATLPHSKSHQHLKNDSNGIQEHGDERPQQLLSPLSSSASNLRQQANCAGCGERIHDGKALIALDLHWHVSCFKCAHCKVPLHGEYVAKDGEAYCERDYQKLFGIACVYCKRYITGKVLQAGEAHHFHPSCARCSKCGDIFVPGEEMYLQGEVTWHPRCGPNTVGLADSVMMPASPGPPLSSANGDGSTIDMAALDGSARSKLRTPRANSPTPSSRSRSRSASPYSFMSRQHYGRASPGYADSEAVGDLSRIYTISYLNSDPNQGYLRRPIEPNPPKSPQFSRPISSSRMSGTAPSDRSRCSSRSQLYSSNRDRSVPRGMYSVLSGMGRSGSSIRARSPSMMNEEAIHLAQYPSGQKPSPDSVPPVERDDFPAPPFPYHPDRARGRSAAAATSHTTSTSKPNDIDDDQRTDDRLNGHGGASRQERASRSRAREVSQHPRASKEPTDLDSTSDDFDPQFRKEEEELSKIANGIGKIFLQTLKEREKLRAWKRANLDPRNSSRTPSATRELPHRMRYDNPTNASPSRDLDRPRPWDESDEAQHSTIYGHTPGECSPTHTNSSLGRGLNNRELATGSGSSYGYKVVQSNRTTPKPGYGLTGGPYSGSNGTVCSTATGTTTANNDSGWQQQHGNNNNQSASSTLSFVEQQRLAQMRSADLLGRAASQMPHSQSGIFNRNLRDSSTLGAKSQIAAGNKTSTLASSAAHLRRSMPNVANLSHVHHDGPPKLYPYHLLATSNYRLPPEVDRCHLERHLSTEEFQYIFHCDRLEFYRLPEWKRNELKRRAKLF